jgi:hypothetical protein
MRSYSYVLSQAIAKLVCALALQSAYGLDIEENNPPQQIPDGQMKIGARTLQLPTGPWIFVAKNQDHTSDALRMSKATHPKTFTAYAMSAQDNAMRVGVVLKLPLDSSSVDRWVDEPCKVKDPLYKDDFQSGFNFPECLLIFKRKTHLTRSKDTFYVQAKEWLTAQNIRNPGPVYEVQYFRFAANEFGWVRIFIPESNAISETEVIEYAKQLPASLKTFFEKRITNASLPPLPIKGGSR